MKFSDIDCLVFESLCDTLLNDLLDIGVCCDELRVLFYELKFSVVWDLFLLTFNLLIMTFLDRLNCFITRYLHQPSGVRLEV
jgi:hypothetical protein